MNKNLLLALCVAVAAPCLAQQKSQTRLLQKTTNTTDVQSGSATNETTSYNYGENGWLATESSSDGGQYAYEYELNGAGYMVKQVICRTDANGDKRYTKTERTLNENNKVLKEVQYVKNGDADYYKSYEDLYEYNHNPDGVVIDRRSYNQDGTLYYAAFAFWAKDAGKYVNGSAGFTPKKARVEVEVDRANMSYQVKTYRPSSSDESKFCLSAERHISFGSDACVRDYYYLYYDEAGTLVGSNGTKYEIVTDPATHLLTVTTNKVVVEDGAVAFEMTAKKEVSYNVYAGLPDSYENGDRYEKSLYPTADFSKMTWLTPNVYLWEQSGYTPEVRHVAPNGSVAPCALAESPDGTFAAKLDADPSSGLDYAELYVFNNKYELLKTVRFNTTDFAWIPEYENTVYCLEEKDGDSWKPMANGSVYEGGDLYITDEQGRIKDNRYYAKIAGEEDYSALSGRFYTYSPNSVTKVTYDGDNKDNPIWEKSYVKDGKVVTNTNSLFILGEKQPRPDSKVVIETVTVDNVTDVKTAKYMYDRTSGQWKLNSSSLVQTEALADGGVVESSYNITADDTKVPVSKSMYKTDAYDWYRYGYEWNSTLNDWVGTTGYSTKLQVGKEFVYTEPANVLEHFYDLLSVPEFYTYKTNLGKCSKQYAWNADTNEWDVTSMEGYEVSDDGRLMTNLAAYTNSSATMVWEVDAENRLIRSVEKTDYYKSPEFSREIETRYEYNADGHLAKLVSDYLTNSSHSKTETVYTYGSITTGIDNAHVSATGLGIDGRTLSIDGAWLMLYNVAGQCVAQGKGSVTAPTPGVYVLKSGNNTWKMMLK